ncbi:hypothetical protein H2201_009042, partial [Coniosporium apollinis]
MPTSSSTEPKMLAPDKVLLAQIFPDNLPSSIKILAQTPETCTFIATFEDANTTTHVTSKVVVRLETPRDRLRVATALQAIAVLVIPNLIPEVYRCGRAIAGGEAGLDFSVTEFVTNVVTLESILHGLSEDQEAGLMSELVMAIRRIQGLDLDSTHIRAILAATPLLRSTEQGDNSGARTGVGTLAAGGLAVA